MKFVGTKIVYEGSSGGVLDADTTNPVGTLNALLSRLREAGLVPAGGTAIGPDGGSGGGGDGLTAEQVQDLVDNLLADTASVTSSYDDGSGILTLNVPTEWLQDQVGAMVSGGTHIGVTATYDDTGGTLNFGVDSESIRDVAGAALASGVHVGATVTNDDVNDRINIVVDGEYIRDNVASFVAPGTSMSITHDDSANTLTFDLNLEWLQDQVGAMVAGAETGLTVVYDDPTGTFQFTLDNEYVRDLIGSMFAAGTHTGATVTHDDTANSISVAVDPEFVRDTIAAALVAGSNISIVHDDVNNTITINATPGGSGYTDEQAQDAAAQLLTTGSHSGITFAYQDVSGRVDAAVDEEWLQDRIAAALVEGAGVDLTYDDTAGTITVAAIPPTEEFVYDTVTPMLVAGANVTITPNDTNNTWTFSTPAGTTQEQIEDYVAGLLSAGDHSGVSAAYQDSATPPRIDLTLLSGTIRNVKDFGAVGDNATMDHVAIQACIDGANEGDCIVFPEGNYLHGATVRFRYRLSYKGLGLPSFCELKMAAGANLNAVWAIAGWEENTNTNSVWPVHFEGLQFNANSHNQTAGDGHCLVHQNFRSVFKNLHLVYFRGDGIRQSSTSRDGSVTIGNTMVESWYESCFFDGTIVVPDPGGVVYEGFAGLHVYDPTRNKCTDGFVTNCILSGAQYAVLARCAAGWKFNGNHTYGNSKSPFKIDRPWQTDIKNNYIEPYGYSSTAGNYYGIDCASGFAADNERPSIISGNTIKFAASAGVQAGTTIRGIGYVVANGTVEDGPNSSNVIIANNAIYGAPHAGPSVSRAISIANQGSLCTLRASITGNMISGFTEKFGKNANGGTILLEGDFKETNMVPGTTRGFNFLPTVTGPPAGTPEDLTQGVPFVLEVPAMVLWAYYSGAWNSISGGSSGGVTLDSDGNVPLANLKLANRADRRPRLRTEQIITRFQSGHGWAAAAHSVANTNLNDTTDFLFGSQSAKFATVGDAAFATLSRGSQPAVDFTKQKQIRVWLKVPSFTNIGSMSLWAAGAGGITGGNHHSWTLYSAATAPANKNLIREGEWVSVAVSPTGSTKTGTPSETAITDWRLSVTDTGGVGATVYFGGIDIGVGGLPQYPSGVITISFDGSNPGIYDLAKDSLGAYGYQATLFPIVEPLASGWDPANYLTAAEVKTLHDALGWEVGITRYEWDYTTYSSLTTAQARDDFFAAKKWLLNNGYSNGLNLFAYPNGDHPHALVDALKPYFDAARGAHTASQGGSTEPLHPNNMTMLKGRTGVGGVGGTAVTAFTNSGGSLDRLMATGGWLHFVFREVTSGAASTINQISKANLDALLAGINSRGIPVATMGEVVRAIKTSGTGKLESFGHVKPVLKAGTNITLTPDAVTQEITIEAAGLTTGPNPPSGTPTVPAGTTATYLDTTSGTLYSYYSGAWRAVTGSSSFVPAETFSAEPPDGDPFPDPVGIAKHIDTSTKIPYYFISGDWYQGAALTLYTPPASDPWGGQLPAAAAGTTATIFESGLRGTEWQTMWSSLNNSTYGDGNNEKQVYFTRNIEREAVTNRMILRQKAEVPPERDGDPLPLENWTSVFLSMRDGPGYLVPMYCFVAVRAKIPQSASVWPAFWLRHMNGSGEGEVDIMEGFHAQVPGRTTTNLHLNGITQPAASVKKHTVVSDDYHTWWCRIDPVGGTPSAPTSVRFRMGVDTVTEVDYSVNNDSGNASRWSNWMVPGSLNNQWDLAINVAIGGNWVVDPALDPMPQSGGLVVLQNGSTGASYGSVTPTVFPTQMILDRVLIAKTAG